MTLTLKDMCCALKNVLPDKNSEEIDGISDEALLATDLKADWGLDSLDVIEMLMDLQSKFQIPEYIFSEIYFGVLEGSLSIESVLSCFNNTLNKNQ